MKTASHCLAAALLLLSACTEKKKAAGLDFAAYGDCRHNTDVHRKVAASMAAAGPQYVLVSGDLTDEPEEEKAWDEFRDVVKGLRAGTRYYCSFGDHDGTSDAKSKNLFLKEMGQTRNYFDVREGDAHVFVLDSRSRFTDPAQVAWLRRRRRPPRRPTSSPCSTTRRS